MAHQLIKPPKAEPGDHIAVLSPSFAAAGAFPAVHEQAMRRLTEVTGLVPVEFPTTRQVGAAPAARAADINAAFAGCDDRRVTQASLQTDRIKLVPLSDEHLELEVELDSDPEVMRYLTGQGRTRAQVMAAHRLRLATAEPVPGLGFWVGFVEDQFVGWWLLEPPGWDEKKPVHGQAELGYRLLRRYWRHGLASEGSRELLRHAFEDLDLHRVFALTMTVNAGSRATMAGVGLQYVRTFHDDDADEGPAGSELGGVEYAITRDEWRAANLEPKA